MPEVTGRTIGIKIGTFSSSRVSTEPCPLSIHNHSVVPVPLRLSSCLPKKSREHMDDLMLKIRSRYKYRHHQDLSYTVDACVCMSSPMFCCTVFFIPAQAHSHLFPADNFRPYLTSFQGNTHTDYINAVFVDVSSASESRLCATCLTYEWYLLVILQGYRQSKGYIVTEWPLPHTSSYLWSLVYDYDASAVVVLANPEPSPVILLIQLVHLYVFMYDAYWF